MKGMSYKKEEAYENMRKAGREIHKDLKKNMKAGGKTMRGKAGK